MLAAGAIARPTANRKATERSSARPVSSDIDADTMREAAFAPRPAEPVRRGPSRLPKVEAFPPVGSSAGTTAGEAGASSADLDGDATQRESESLATRGGNRPRKRSRLFARLKGSFQESTPDEVSDLQRIAREMKAIDEEPAAPSTDEGNEEIPGFFRRQARR